MKFSDYDLMLKYQMLQYEATRVYRGDPKLYEDGKTLEIFPDSIDMVNNKKPSFMFGTVVYLCYKDNILMLEPQKEDRVIETLSGLGGKVKAKINGIVADSEKADIEKIMRAYKYGELDTMEKMRGAAAREVMEETSTYEIDDFGKYTHSIEDVGIIINPKALNYIGSSRIRIINSDATQSWLILNYDYNLSDEEYEYIENDISKVNREGTLHWISREEVSSYVSGSDQIILQMRNPDVIVTEIRDNVNNHNILRLSVNDDERSETFIDYKVVSCNDDKISVMPVYPKKYISQKRK